MEGRWKRLLAGGVLFIMIGCSHTRDRKPSRHNNTGEPPLGAMSTKPSDEKRAKDQTPAKVETFLAVGNVRIQAATDPNRSPGERDELLEQGRQAFQQILQREPKNTEAMLGMARLYHVMRDKEKCLEWYERAAKLNPTRGDIQHEMGHALSAGFKDREAALLCFHAATKIDPENRKYRKTLGFALAHVGRYEEGYAWLSRCMQPAEAHLNLARMMDHNGHHEQATKHFAMAAQADPGNETAKMALNNTIPTIEKIPEVSPIQTASYEQIPNETPPKANPQSARKQSLPEAPVVGEYKRADPIASIRAPELLPVREARPSRATPGLVPTNGWDK
ncbi:MAG: tetratricopeptide repeat protein [Planctomycetes bacterium]|nr:tetratricopeptide repeat protein [Planctomycetota bacterium]